MTMAPEPVIENAGSGEPAASAPAYTQTGPQPWMRTETTRVSRW